MNFSNVRRGKGIDGAERMPRVPVQTLLDYLEDGETIDGFLAGFPTVARASDRVP